MQVIIVLGHRLKNDGQPTIELFKRLDLGIKLFNKFNVGAIIFSGGMASSSAGVTEAKVMKEYAISKGIPSHKIILEEKSLDTISNAIFTKELIKERFNELYIVTSCYHVDRASFIFKMVFGEEYKLNFDYCAATEQKERFEDIKLSQAKMFFKSLLPGDDAELKRGISKHELYNTDKSRLFNKSNYT